MKVFQMNDCEWWMAETLEQAKRDYMASGHELPEDEAMDNPHEVSEADMDRLVFATEPELGTKSPRCTFRYELARRISEGGDSQFFAGTEC